MTIAWAMECHTGASWKKKSWMGLSFPGAMATVVELVRKMAEREGCGAVLANGSAYAAATWGEAEYLQTASGIELPMADPRFAPAMPGPTACDPTPGRHVKADWAFYINRTNRKTNMTIPAPAMRISEYCQQEIINCAGFAISGI